ncbi:MAG: nicotinate-nucleotide adenylyltransferase [Bacteroidales bacterium]|nr:nicotinate-nucleotide adenylyltransferase [Bacteroidales bacterium]
MQNKREILLYFGSFNPIHIGHLAIANYLVEYTGVNELWFVVTPHNPLKKSSTLIDDRVRQYLVQLAIGNYPKFRVSDIEFYLPKPNYTINTLTHLSEKYPDYNFSILIGGDNLETFHKWKNYDVILKNYKIYVYRRPGCNVVEYENSHIEIVDAPLIEISSSFIRESIRQGKDVRFFMPEEVASYIDQMGYWKERPCFEPKE